MLALALLVVGYISIKSDDKPSVTTSQGGIVTERFDSGIDNENQEFLRVLKNLQNVSLDGSILSSEVFASLVDFGIELTPQPKGRSNPFLPIDSNELSNVATSS